MLMRLKTLPVIVLIGVCLFLTPVMSAESHLEYVGQLEEQLFSTKYENEDISRRLSRLEETIFGMDTPKEKANIRVEKLKALLSPEPVEESEPSDSDQSSHSSQLATSQQTSNNVYQDFSTSQPSANNSQAYEYVPVHPDDEEVEDYPAVSFIESQVFNEKYQGEDISKRLERLEKNIFNETKEDKALSERLDELKVAVMGTTNMNLATRQTGGYNPQDIETYYQSNQNYNPNQYQGPEMKTFQQDPQNLNNYNSYQYQPVEPGYDSGQISQQSLMEVTSRLEQELLGQSFPQEQLNNRLDRLEMHVFNRTATGYTPESRIERLVAVSAADATSDPHDMKKVKRLRKIQTGLTVGGIIFSLLRGFLF